MESMKVSMKARDVGRYLSEACCNAPRMKWEGVTETPRKK